MQKVVLIGTTSMGPAYYILSILIWITLDNLETALLVLLLLKFLACVQFQFNSIFSILVRTAIWKVLPRDKILQSCEIVKCTSFIF